MPAHRPYAPADGPCPGSSHNHLKYALTALALAGAVAHATTVIDNASGSTLDAAYAGHQEKTLGSLEAGKYANFIVADRDLFKISPYDIHTIGVLDTWVGGRRIWQKM